MGSKALRLVTLGFVLCTLCIQGPFRAGRVLATPGNEVAPANCILQEVASVGVRSVQDGAAHTLLWNFEEGELLETTVAVRTGSGTVAWETADGVPLYSVTLGAGEQVTHASPAAQVRVYPAVAELSPTRGRSNDWAARPGGRRRAARPSAVTGRRSTACTRASRTRRPPSPSR